jgi:hypothetical protein
LTARADKSSIAPINPSVKNTDGLRFNMVLKEVMALYNVT